MSSNPNSGTGKLRLRQVRSWSKFMSQLAAELGFDSDHTASRYGIMHMTVFYKLLRVLNKCSLVCSSSLMNFRDQKTL